MERNRVAKIGKLWYQTCGNRLFLTLESFSPLPWNTCLKILNASSTLGQDLFAYLFVKYQPASRPQICAVVSRDFFWFFQEYSSIKWCMAAIFLFQIARNMLLYTVKLLSTPLTVMPYRKICINEQFNFIWMHAQKNISLLKHENERTVDR